MADNSTSDAPTNLADALELIAQQARQIEQLQKQVDDEHFAADLRNALIIAASAGTIGSPVTHDRLLEMIVAAAAQVINVKAGALMLISEETGELVFEVALGHKAEETRKFTVPLGKGIAGLVAVTGQPMAVSHVDQDPRWAPEIARSIDYTPQNMLCVPLFYNDRIIGVLEFLDKQGASSFSAADMEVLGLFANTAAVAIEQSRTHQNLVALIGEVLASLGGVTAEQKAQLAAQAPTFTAGLVAEPAYQQALDLARLVQEITWQGEQEQLACRTILQGFADYLRQRQVAANAPGGW